MKFDANIYTFICAGFDGFIIKMVFINEKVYIPKPPDIKLLTLLF